MHLNFTMASDCFNVQCREEKKAKSWCCFIITKKKRKTDLHQVQAVIGRIFFFGVGWFSKQFHLAECLCIVVVLYLLNCELLARQDNVSFINFKM